jgi:large subunit ribosomal protein L15
MPYKRGFKNPFKKVFEVVNLGTFTELELEDPVTPESLYERGVTRSVDIPVKILADGEITKAYTVRAHKFSAKAKEKIEAAGGTVEVIE